MAQVKRRRRAPVAHTEVVYSAAVSLDGFIADADGGVDWLHAALVPGEGYGLREFQASIDAVLMGRATYEKSLALGAPGGGSSTPSWVFSTGDRFTSRGAMTVTGADPREVVASLPGQGIRRAWLMGGGKLAASFLAAGLIDEIAVAVMPVVLGRGIPVFDGALPATSLQLVESKTYQGGALGLRYRRAE